jgi:hypothetical protein
VEATSLSAPPSDDQRVPVSIGWAKTGERVPQMTMYQAEDSDDAHWDAFAHRIGKRGGGWEDE